MQLFGVFLIKKLTNNLYYSEKKTKHEYEIGLTVILHTHLVFGG